MIDDDFFIDDDDLTCDNEDSVNSFIINVSATSDHEYKRSKSDLEIEQILYQNKLMLVR